MGTGRPFRKALIVLANDFQFTSGQRIHWPRVKSRMLLWCRYGRGEVKVNRRKYALPPGEFLFLPWDHAITYEAEWKEPFQVAGIHIIPDHPQGQPLELGVSHSPGDPISRCTWRRDAELPGLVEVYQGRFREGSGLKPLAEYVVNRFQRSALAEHQGRALAVLVLEELFHFAAQEADSGGDLPPALRQMLHLVRRQTDKKISLENLADFSGLSLSTVGRMFRRHLGVTPMQWITRTRMEQAARLLAGSWTPVSVVARRVGMEDPYYFSKLFKKVMGLSPRAYRKRAALF